MKLELAHQALPAGVSLPASTLGWMIVIVWLEWLFHLLLTKKIYCINCLITLFDNSWLITQFGRLGRAMPGKVPYFICFSYFWKPISVYPSSWFCVRPKTDRLRHSAYCHVRYTWWVKASFDVWWDCRGTTTQLAVVHRCEFRF